MNSNRSTRTAKLLFFLIAASVMVAAGCYYDSEEALYPAVNTVCDTVNVTFSKNIQPILRASCLSCHSNANAPTFGDNVRLESYTDVVAAYPRIRLAITHQQGAVPMPKDSAPLSDCQVTQFEIWNAGGSPQ